MSELRTVNQIKLSPEESSQMLADKYVQEMAAHGQQVLATGKEMSLKITTKGEMVITRDPPWTEPAEGVPPADPVA